MFALRRAPSRLAISILARGNATTTAATPTDTAAPPPPPPAKVEAKSTPKTARAVDPEPTSASEAQPETDATAQDAKKTARKYPTKRPRISLEHPRQWSRPIGVGVLRAYDEALEYIKHDSTLRTRELENYRAALQKAESAKPVDPAEVERLQEKVKILEIQSEINLPSVRWKARNGLGDMSKAVYRHLIEQRWREDGALDLLMERIYQMNVVPDLLPDLRPTIDLRVNYLEAPPQSVYLRTRVKRKFTLVEPGIFLLPEQTRKQPMLYTTVFHTETRLYTLLMVDLDVPDPENATYQAYLHWMQPNIPLFATSSGKISLSTTHTPYIPPHPQQGTPYHRYVILLLPQENPTERIKIPVFTENERLGFNFRAFAQEYGLDGSRGGGVYMFRENWDETVSHIYQHVLKTGEPKFGKPPKIDPYAEVKKTQKYFS